MNIKAYQPSNGGFVHAGFRRSRSSRSPVGARTLNGQELPTKVFVGGVATRTTEEDLRGVMCRYARVKNLKIVTDWNVNGKNEEPRRYAFVEFDTEDEAQHVLKTLKADILELHGRRLNINNAYRKTPTIGLTFGDQNQKFEDPGNGPNKNGQRASLSPAQNTVNGNFSQYSAYDQIPNPPYYGNYGYYAGNGHTGWQQPFYGAQQLNWSLPQTPIHGSPPNRISPQFVYSTGSPPANFDMGHQSAYYYPNPGHFNQQQFAYSPMHVGNGYAGQYAGWYGYPQDGFGRAESERGM